MTDYLDIEALSIELDELRDLDEEDMDNEMFERLDLLLALKRELGGTLDVDGMFIPEDEFEDFCQGMAEDAGYIDPEGPMHMYVDWGRWVSTVGERTGVPPNGLRFNSARLHH